MSHEHTGNCVGDPIRLQVILRPSPEHIPGCIMNHNHNHFVRLTPHTAQRLRDIAVSKVIPNDTRTPPRTHHHPPPPPHHPPKPPSRRQWLIHQQQQHHPIPTSTTSCCESGIEFLPLAITFESTGDIIYASYNGGGGEGRMWWNPTNDSDSSNRHHNNNNNNDSDTSLNQPGTFHKKIKMMIDVPNDE